MSPVIQGILRHLLTVAGGALVSLGYIDENGAQAAAGAIATLAAIVWSIIEKKSRA